MAAASNGQRKKGGKRQVVMATACDRLSFGLIGHKKKIGGKKKRGGERQVVMVTACNGQRKKRGGERQVAMVAACNRSSFGWIGCKNKRGDKMQEAMTVT